MRLVHLAQQILASHLQPGNVVVDATVGNGHDTAFLAQCVGEQGRVFGFDIQSTALEKTLQRLQQQCPQVPVQLFQAGHEQMVQHIPQSYHGQVKAVVFNLGYLPGANHAVITQAQTTRLALEQSVKLLSREGIISIMVYPGHPGGAEETNEVSQWVQTLPSDLWSCQEHCPEQRNNPPCWIFVERI